MWFLIIFFTCRTGRDQHQTKGRYRQIKRIQTNEFKSIVTSPLKISLELEVHRLLLLYNISKKCDVSIYLRW